MRLLLALALVAGCKSSNSQNDMGPADLRAGPSVCGRLVDEAGKGRGEIRTQLCSKEVCLVSTTGSDGSVCFAPDRAGDYHFRAFSDIALTRADAFFPFPIGSEVTQPGFSAPFGDAVAQSVTGAQMIVAANGGRFAFAGGITIIVPAGGIELPGFEPTSPIAAIKVPGDPRMLATHAGTNEGVYLLMPFGSLCDKAGGKACAVILPNPGGLAEGTVLEIAMADFDTAALVAHGEAKVENGAIVSQPGQGLGALGFIALFKK